MNRLILPAACAALAAFAMAAPLPALAAEKGGEKVNQLIVYGKDPCPASTDDQITVCARKDEGERFRIPEDLRENPNQSSNQAWTDRVKAYETVGAFGTNSCSPVGASGDTGCLAKLINNAYAERKQSSSVRFGKLIEAEREKRLESVDADAAAEQARVESLEKEYDARLAKERTQGDAPPAGARPAPGSLAAPPADVEQGGHQ
ncbi:hypothetical protein [Novosphingobium sp. Fuku2-ISO-50]|uniref:hypothetical protein n=1 Tax=Novosphingobium sp. Fuku2-ISO-50 TaxID=1739114 RepID=UPI00076DCF25|nr:hypothetical protein [Novosphingobium sp. Fuku2-ISO-50]KUR77349.1 hypothetical protein AQZ50_11110 [Novosphingobium sp. Fuku2-ISO-50]